MKPSVYAILAAAICAACSGSALEVTPVQKVVEMLQGMLSKCKDQKREEQVDYASYKAFCVNTIREKTADIKAADEEIELLQANIQMAETDAIEYGKKVDQLNADIAQWTADQKAATASRESTRAEYVKSHKEYTDTIDAIGKAYRVLSVQSTRKIPAVSLLMNAKGLDKLPEAKQVLAAFLADVDNEAPASFSANAGGLASSAAADLTPDNAYEFKGSTILDMLDKLKTKFVDERTQIEKEEMNSKHAYELLVQDLKRSIQAAEEAVSQKVQQKAKALQTAATLKGQLEDAVVTRASDQKYLSETTATCKQKESDYEDRQKLREEEIVAIEKAVEILSSDQLRSSATKYSSMIQTLKPRGAALAQTRTAGQSPAQIRVAKFLDHKAEHLNSRVLSALAVRVREDPFSKVKKMIQDLIMRLMEEAGEEAQHKAWCDAELASNELARTSRAVDVERLASEIDNLKSSIAELTLQLKDHAQQITETDKQIATMTAIRQKEKTQNEQTLRDAREAQTALGQAVTVLKEFYARAAEATSLVQGKKQEPPPVFQGGPYNGLSESGGVVAMLEVIQSDYARLESTTSANEVTSQQDYDKQMTDYAVLKAQLQKDVEHKTRLKQSKEQALVDRSNDLTSAQKELDAANRYFEKLKPSCLDAGMSFEERNQRRQQEVESLQEALRILNGEDIAA